MRIGQIYNIWSKHQYQETNISFKLFYTQEANILVNLYNLPGDRLSADHTLLFTRRQTFQSSFIIYQDTNISVKLCYLTKRQTFQSSFIIYQEINILVKL